MLNEFIPCKIFYVNVQFKLQLNKHVIAQMFLPIGASSFPISQTQM